MNTPMTPESIKKFFEQASKAYADGWKTQAEYVEGLVRRNTKCLTELADARLTSYKEMSEAKTFNQAFESNLAFEEKVREELVGLQEANTKSWDDLVKNLKTIYTPPKEAPKTKAAAPKKAKAKSAASKKAKAKAPVAKTKKAA
jgi:hypothetical protein